MARIGIFGGTFDPVHVGHLLCAEQAREALELDTVLFVPVSIPAASKQEPVASASVRLAMCELAVADNDRFQVSAVDIARGGITYTVDTLLDLQREFPDDELFFITGSDAAKSLPEWYRPKTLAGLARFVVVERPGSALSEEEAARLASRGFSIHRVCTAQFDASSTDIRRRLREGRSIRYLCTQPICEYIARTGLYGGDAR